MQILLAKPLVSKWKLDLIERVKAFQKKRGLPPGLAVFLIGEDAASQVYVRKKIEACSQVGIRHWEEIQPSSASPEKVKARIKELNKNPEVHGILIQLPLPPSWDAEELISCLSPQKDPDGLTLENRGLLWLGKPRVVPCTPLGIMELLKFYKIPLEAKRAVVVGRSQIVGLPLFQQLLKHNVTVTLCHSRTKNLREHTSQADLVFCCTGQKHLLQKEDFKKGAVVIDVGIHREKGGLTGDVQPEGLEGWLSGITPVPGGVGPMTIMMLLFNTIQLAEKSFQNGES